MIEIGKYKVERYENGYRLYSPTSVNEKTGEQNYRLSYWGCLLHVCNAIVSREADDSVEVKDAGQIVARLNEISDEIETALRKNNII